MKTLVFDNYDSFTYNLVHLIEAINGKRPDVFRNDQVALEKVGTYDKIILSPGPGIPEEAGLLLPLLKEFASTKSILGVCLGHQAIGEAFGASLLNLDKVYHGVASLIAQEANGGYLFEGIPKTFKAGRYHSWIVDEQTLPVDFFVTARDEENRVMAMQHKTLDLAGVQFHPESIMTEYGEQLMRNFLTR